MRGMDVKEKLEKGREREKERGRKLIRRDK